MVICSACGQTLCVEDFPQAVVHGVAKVLTGLLILLDGGPGNLLMDPALAQHHGCPGAGVRVVWENLDRPDPGAEPARPHRPTPAPAGLPQAPDPPRCRCTGPRKAEPLDRADVPYRPPGRGGAR